MFQRPKAHSIFATAAIFFLGLARVEADRFPSGCGLPTGSGDASSTSIAANANFVRVGQIMEYRVSLQNPIQDNFGDPSCAITNAHVDLTLPDRTVLPILTNIALNPGDPPVICPQDPRCITKTVGPAGFGYPYTVNLADVTNITFASQCPLPAGTNAAIIANTSGGASVRNTEAGFGSASYLRCRPVRVNLPCVTCTKFCTNAIGDSGMITFSGTVLNCGNNSFLANITVSNLVGGVLVPVTLSTNGLNLGETATFSGSYFPPNPCLPTTDTILVMGEDSLTLEVVSNSCTATCSNILAPAIFVAKFCPTNLVQPGAALVFSGSVSNAGNVTLTNVIVVNNQPASNTPVFGPVTLAPGQSTNFTGSYNVPPNSCPPYPDTLTARGTSICGVSVTNSANAICPGTNSPAITVSKSCPPSPVPPGGTMIISGVVSNAGNITLTNVTVTNVIAAIGQNHLVVGPINLPPGARVPFTDQYVVPLNTCGPYRDTVIASGADKCFGRIVTASDFKDCPGITTPRLALVKRCPPNPVAPGSVATFSGTVSNAGNITLTNVQVFNNRPTNNTPLLTVTNLAPGEFRNFTGTELVPANCCTYFDELTASAASICTGSNVTASASAACPTLVLPALVVTKSCFCPTGPVPLGQPMQFTGTVSNSGNITLINVIVEDNRPVNHTPVTGPLTLAPGETASFSGSYLVPLNLCDTTLSDTVTASGADVCLGSNVTATATAVCPISPNPKLFVTKQCPPNPVAPGQLLVYTGTVTNVGGVMITNIVVVDDRPAPNTVILTNISLAPGQGTNFSGSYIAPYDCCGPCVDTVTATGKDVCAGSNVIATATAACPRVTTPAIGVTRNCPPGPVTVGDLVFFDGIVTNAGNATLRNVTVVDDQAGNVLNNIFLSPGEAVAFTGMYLVTNCGPSVPSGITATANDLCTLAAVTNRFTTTCAALCAPTGPVIFGSKVDGPNFVFSFTTETNRTYTIQSSPTLSPPNWQSIATFAGDGAVVTIIDAILSGQKFYRVLIE